VGAENLEIVRRWLAPISANLDEIRAKVAEFCDPDVDYYPVRKFPEAQPCHGREEFSQFLVRFREPWSRFEWAINELIEVGDDRVLACLSMRAEGSESGMSLEGDVYQCFWLRHGRFFREEDHLTSSGALHALGLEGDTLEATGLRAPSNIDLLRSICAGWERGDFSSAEWAHPEIEFVIADGAVAGSWTGLAGLAEGFREIISPMEQYRIVIDDYRELEDGRVLALCHQYGRGKMSGLELEEIQAKAAVVFAIRDRRVTKLTIYGDPELALADLGLSSEASAST
jgi:SnoaL-like protein